MGMEGSRLRLLGPEPCCPPCPALSWLLPWTIKGLNHGAALTLCAARLGAGVGWIGPGEPLVREGGVSVGPQGHRLEEFYFKWLPDAGGGGGGALPVVRGVHVDLGTGGG